MSRENRFSQIVRALDKLPGYREWGGSLPFDDIGLYFKEVHRVGMTRDGPLLGAQIDGLNVALKIVKLSKEESLKDNFMNTSNINKLSKNAMEFAGIPIKNAWREIAAMDMVSPQNSNFKNFPYFYGFYMLKWPDTMKEDYEISNIMKNSSLSKYVKSREKNRVCVLIVMELFSETLLEWTNEIHSENEWVNIYSQIRNILDMLNKLDIVHQDAHTQNYMVKRYGGGDLLALIDWGQALSPSFDLTPAEKKHYTLLKLEQRDMWLTFDYFNSEFIAIHHFRQRHAKDLIDLVETKYPKFYKMVLDAVPKNRKDSFGKKWILITHNLGQNWKYFKSLLGNDLKKLPPQDIDTKITNAVKKIKKGLTKKRTKIISDTMSFLRKL